MCEWESGPGVPGWCCGDELAGRIQCCLPCSVLPEELSLALLALIRSSHFMGFFTSYNIFFRLKGYGEKTCIPLFCFQSTKLHFCHFTFTYRQLYFWFNFRAYCFWFCTWYFCSSGTLSSLWRATYSCLAKTLLAPHSKFWCRTNLYSCAGSHIESRCSLKIQMEANMPAELKLKNNPI